MEVNKIPKDKVNNVKDITSNQSKILFGILLNPKYYTCQIIYDIKGDLDLETFRRSWHAVVEKNECLRMLFRKTNRGVYIQIIMKNNENFLTIYDDHTINSANDSYLEVLQNDQCYVSNIEHIPFKVSLIKFGLHHYKMIVSHNHILYDGWSGNILLNQFLNAYIHEGQMLISVEPQKSGNYIQDIDIKLEKSYWENYLEGYVPYQSNIKAESTENDIKCESITIDSSVCNQIKEFAMRKKRTVAEIFYFIWFIILQKYYDQSDILFGITSAGRDQSNIYDVGIIHIRISFSL